MLIPDIFSVVDWSDIQNIAGLPLRIGHHLHDVVSVRGDAEAVRRDDGMDGIVVARHGATKMEFKSIERRRLLKGRLMLK